LDKFGNPQSLDELGNHAFLQYGLSNEAKLQLTDKEGKHHTVPIQSKISANNGDFLKLMTLQGHGITYVPTFMVYQELADGRLISLLTDYQIPSMNAYAVYPKNRFLPERCRRFIDFLSERFGEHPYWDCQIG
jgi:DNA-binding transcriptional LysR family regulator